MLSILFIFFSVAAVLIGTFVGGMFFEYRNQTIREQKKYEFKPESDDEV